MNTKSVSKGPFSAEEVRWLLQASETQQWLLLSSHFHFIALFLRFAALSDVRARLRAHESSLHTASDQLLILKQFGNK